MSSPIKLDSAALLLQPQRRSLFLYSSSSSWRINHKVHRAHRLEQRRGLLAVWPPESRLLRPEAQRRLQPKRWNMCQLLRVRSARQMSAVVDPKSRVALVTKTILKRISCKTTRTSSFSRIRHVMQSPQVAGPLLLLVSIRALIHCAWRSSIGLRMWNTRQEARSDLSY